MEWKKGDYRISDDKGELDLFYLVPAIQKSYWAPERTKEVVEVSIRNSICLGLYKDDRQVGFARAVTDGCTFAWVCDVMVHPDHRGIGLGKFLVDCLTKHSSMTAVELQLLVTKDAHGLYEQFGYSICEAMIRKNGNSDW